MISTILIIIAYLIEPIVWVNSMCLKFKRKYMSLLLLMPYIILDISISLIKEFTNITKVLDDTFFTFLMFVYALAFVIIFFQGKVIEKILHIGILFIMSLVSDFMSIGLFMITGCSISELAEQGQLNAFATLLSKIILFMVTMLWFKKEKKIDNELIPIILSTILLETPCITLFNQMTLINNNDALLLTFVFGQIGLLIVVIYTMYILKKRRRTEEELKNWTRDIEMQLRGSEAAEETLENLRLLRHDMKQHIGVIKAMIKGKRYNEVEQYLDTVYKDVDIADEYFTLENRSVSITLNMLKQYARSNEVNLYTKIMTSDFKINDVDICAILSNTVRNAIEAAATTSEKYCKLIIEKTSNNIHISCNNTFLEKPVLKKGEYISTKGDERGYGIKIIKRAVKKNSGKVLFYIEGDLFKVDIYI